MAKRRKRRKRYTEKDRALKAEHTMRVTLIKTRLTFDGEEEVWYQWKGVCPYCKRKHYHPACSVESEEDPRKNGSLNRVRQSHCLTQKYKSK